MTRPYRFVRLDKSMQPIEELDLVCPSAADALLVGSRLGWCVEVWDGAQRIGLAGSGLPQGPEPAPEPREEVERADVELAAPTQDTSAFNPFRPRAWRRLTRIS